VLVIDNSAAERALRAVALDRNSYLLAGSDCGRDRAAAFYSLIGLAKLNGLDLEFYLRDVLSQIADHLVSRVEEFLSWNHTPEHTGSILPGRLSTFIRCSRRKVAIEKRLLSAKCDTDRAGYGGLKRLRSDCEIAKALFRRGY